MSVAVPVRVRVNHALLQLEEPTAPSLRGRDLHVIH